MPSITAYVCRHDYGTTLEPNIRPAVFTTPPANLAALRSAGKVITVSLTEGLTAESFISGVQEIGRQIGLSPVSDAVGEVVFNSVS